MARSPLIWFGGKYYQRKAIISKMPGHKKYREPFVGAAHVISAKERVSHEVINDVDTELVNFLMAVNADPVQFQHEAEAIPYSRHLFERWRKEQLPADPFERALRWFYMNRSAITKGNVDSVPKTGWRHSNSSSQNPAGGYVSACRSIPAFAERMKGVMIECLDFRKFIPKYDAADAVYYVDPPYVGREKYYFGGFKESDHRELACLLNQSKAKVILSYYDDPLIRELYPDWNRESFKAFRQVVGRSGSDIATEEILLMNF